MRPLLPLWFRLPGWVWLRRLLNRPMLNCDRCMAPIWGDAEVNTDIHDNVVCPKCSWLDKRLERRRVT